MKPTETNVPQAAGRIGHSLYPAGPDLYGQKEEIRDRFADIPDKAFLEIMDAIRKGNNWDLKYRT